jgi:RNA polymerase sigma-70 factor (ECF subfamily)
MNVQSLEQATADDATDRALLIAVRAGDRRAFAELYRRYATRVFTYVRNIVRDERSAEELVIDTMTAVWRGAADFRGGSRVSSWILGIARYKAIDAARIRERTPESVPLEDSSSLEAGGLTPFESAFLHQRGAIARRALAQLSEEHREALFLAYYKDLPYQVIARCLDIPENSVKSRVYCARQALKKRLSVLQRA